MTGRNDPCPCGSGKKYKKCHLVENEAPAGPLDRRNRPAGVSRWHDRNATLMRDMMLFRRRHFDDEPLFLPAGPDDPLFAQLIGPWSVYVAPIHGRTLVDIYLEKKGRSLPREDRAFLEAQKLAWLSVWRIDAVDRNAATVSLTDLLTGESRTVHEVSLSRDLEGDLCILARVVDLTDESIIAGSHGAAPPSEEAAEIVRFFLEETGLQLPVAPEDLHKENAELLFELWHEAAGGENEEEPYGDGPTFDPVADDAVVATGIIITIDPAERAAVARRLGDVRGAEPEQGHFSFYERAGAFGLRRKLVAEAVVREREVRAAVFSDGDPDAIAGQIEDAVGTAMQESRRLEFRPSDILPGISAALEFYKSTLEGDPLRPITREDRFRRYSRWHDTPNEHLGGQSPREAFEDPIYKGPLHMMLKTFARFERDVEPELAVDLEALFREMPGFASPSTD